MLYRFRRTPRGVAAKTQRRCSMVRAAIAWGLLALGLFVFAVPSRADEVTTRRIVVFTSGTSRAQRVSMARSTGAKIIRELPLINAVVIETPSNQISAADSKLSAMAEV